MKNEPAFARPASVYGRAPSQEGMTLRDYFAANMALTDDDYPSTYEESAQLMGRTLPDTDDVVANQQWKFELQSKLRYMKADAMLTARVDV